MDYEVDILDKNIERELSDLIKQSNNLDIKLDFASLAHPKIFKAVNKRGYKPSQKDAPMFMTFEAIERVTLLNK